MFNFLMKLVIVSRQTQARASLDFGLPAMVFEASSCNLGITLQNKGDQPITPCGQLMSLFRRARLFASSQLIEDRIELATESVITDRLKDNTRRVNDSISENPHTATNANVSLGLKAGNSRSLIGQTCCWDAQTEQVHPPASGQ